MGGRRVPSYILERRAARAKAREEYYNTKNQGAATFKATVDDRPMTRVGYRSLNTKTGATPDHAKLSIIASQKAVNFFEGLAPTAQPGVGNTNLGLEYVDLADYFGVTKFSASKIHAVQGGVKQAVSTPWGSRYTKTYGATDGNAQAFYTAPISEKTGAFTAQTLRDNAEIISEIAGIQQALGDNGRMWIEPESESYIVYS
ncbi:hypothetical protein [Sphaerothrix gracilis]|uniref:hypothetical protein n=1 Tax=Sphaerothrix gracilis TaxID=3151835 RepID=UPI0031FD4592